MSKLRMLLPALVVLLSLAAAMTATAADALKIVYNVGVAPLKFEDAASRPAGLFPDLWRLWAQKTGRKIKFVRVESFGESLQLLKDGRVDLHAGLFRTPESEEFLDYSEPLLALDYHIFTHPSVYPISSLEKTSGFLVGIQKGGYTEKLVRSKVPDNRIVVYDRFQDLFRAALEGEIKVFVATELSLLYYLKENFQTNIFEHDTDHPLFTQVYYTATGKGNPALIQQVNAGLKAIGSAERKQLANQWISFAGKKIEQGRPEIALTAEEQAWLEQHPVIRVPNEKDWPPFNYFEYGRPRGLSIDYMDLIAAKLGIGVEYVTGPSWNEFLGLIKRKELDVMLNIVRTEDRQKYLLYTEPYVKNPNVIVSYEKNAYDSIAALFGKTVAFPRGFFYEEVLTKSFPRIRRLPVEDTLASLKAVVFGKADAALGEAAVVRTLINKNMLAGLQISGEVNLGNPDLTNLRLAVRDDWPLLQSALTKAMASVTPQEMNRIRQKWLAVDRSDGSPPDVAAGKITIPLSDAESAWLAAHRTIRFTGDPDWLPQEAFTSNGKYIGIVADILDLIEARMGIRFERVPVKTWDEAVRLAETARVDILSETTNSERESLAFTDAYLDFPVVILAQQGAESISDPGKLEGRRVAVVKDYGYVVPLRRQFPDLDYVEVNTVRDGLMRLSAGGVDAFISASPTAFHLMSELGLTNLKVIGFTGLSLELGFGVRRDWPLLVGILNKALATITEQEKLKIRQKWVPVIDTSVAETAVPIAYGRLIAYGLGVFLVLSLLTWILIKAARKEQLAVSFGSRWFRGLVLAGLSFFVIVVCLLGWYTLDKNKTQILTAVDEDLKKTLLTANERVDFWVEQRLSSLKLLGRDPELVTLVKRLLAVTPDRQSLLASDALRDVRDYFKNNRDIFSNLGFFIIKADGVSVGSLRDTNIGTPNLISIQRPDLLRRAFAGEALFVPPIESDVLPGEASRADGTRNPSTKFFMGPIRDSSGQIIAVMTLRVDPTRDFSQILSPSIAHRTGETYAFSEHGELLSESRFSDLLRRVGLIGEDQQSALNVAIRNPGVNLAAGNRPRTERSQQPLTRMVSRAIQLKDSMAKAGQTTGRSRIEVDTNGYRDYRGVPVFGAWTWKADLGLGLATEIDVAEAMSDYYQIRRTVLGVLGVTLVLSVGAVLLVLILGERTSHALMKARDNLEAKVDERTAELQENQRQLETALERSGLILDSAGEGIFGVDLQGKVVFINPAANRMLGYGPDELIGRTVHDKIHHSHEDGSSYPKEECPMYRTYVDGSAHHVSDEVLWRRDGTPFPVEYTSMPIEKDGRIVGAVVTFMDITERRDMAAQIEASKSQLQYILDTGPIGVAFSTKGKIHFANPRFTEMFGVGVGDASPDLYVRPEERDLLIKRLKAEGKIENYDIQMYNRDHEIRDILITYLPFTYDGEDGILGWLLDITDRKNAEEEIQARYTELSRFRRMAIGRELKMIELKKEINALLQADGLSKKYKIHQGSD